MKDEEFIASAIKHYRSQGGQKDVSEDASGVTPVKVQLRNQYGDMVGEYLRTDLLIKKAIEEYSSRYSSDIPSEDASSISKSIVQIRDAEGVLLGQYAPDENGNWSLTKAQEKISAESGNTKQEVLNTGKSIENKEESVVTHATISKSSTPTTGRRGIIIGISVLGLAVAIIVATMVSSGEKNTNTPQSGPEDYKKGLVENSKDLEIIATADPSDSSTVLVGATHSKPPLMILSFAKTKKTAIANAEMKCIDRLKIPSSECYYTELERGYIAVVEGEYAAGITAGSNTADEAWESALKMCIKNSKESGGDGKDCNTVFEYKF